MSFDEEHLDPHGECRHEIARLTRELGRSYRAVRGLYGAVRDPSASSEALRHYHSLTIAAAIRFVEDGSLEGSDYFDGKPVDLLTETLAKADPRKCPTP